MADRAALYRRPAAFDAALAARSADEVRTTASGRALLTPSLPTVWDLNCLRVEVDVPSAPDAAALAREADELLRDAGCSHRRVLVSDESLGESLEPEFEKLGWEVGRWLYMAHEGTIQGPQAPPVVELATEGLLEFRRREHRSDESADEAAIESLVAAWTRLARAGRARHFAVLARGEPASGADLYSDGLTAQIEDVFTLPEHRGHGHARALVEHATYEANAAGDDLVFLVTEEDDWPKELYARCGFVPIGTTHYFTGRPAG